MRIIEDDELHGMKNIGHIVANTLQIMSKAVEACMTTRERGRAWTSETWQCLICAKINL